jgi:hypothetical protein
VLVGEDLQWPVQSQRGAGRVGTGVRFVPRRALYEVDLLGAGEDARTATHPEQPTVGVPHCHDAVALLGRTPEHVVQQGEHAGERMGLAVAH